MNVQYHSKLVVVAEKFLELLNFLLIFAMFALTAGVVALFMFDVYLFFMNKFEKGVIAPIFGTLLLLWVLIELLHTQLDYLKGGRFNISVFLIVAMVAFVRKMMVAVVEPGKYETTYYPLAAILVLGIVFWLIRNAENGMGS